MKSTALRPGGGSTLSVHNVNSNAGTLVLSTSCRSQKPTADAKLVFYRYDQRYFLAEVWNGNSSSGQQDTGQLARQTQLARTDQKSKSCS